jgi:autotransporter adhesin
VDSGKSVVGSKQTTSQMSIGNIGEQGVRVDTNGKMTPTNTLDQSTAALTVTNGQGNTHGFVVNEKSATMSGGTTSTSMTLNNGGARFSNASTGGPARVTGIADGRHDYDAVNYRQLKSVKSGIAGIAAMTNVPHVEQNKKFALGIGVGHYDGTTSMAVGASARLSENAVIKASVSNGVSGGSTRKSTVYGIGAGFSW